MKALIYYGGWDGHDPKPISKLYKRELTKLGFEVTLSDSLDCLDKLSDLKKFDVIVPHWTMGQMTKKQAGNLQKAVKSGVGIAGIHGGMCDSMRGDLNYQWMTGGQFVGHPHVDDYEVYLTETANPITAGMPSRFTYNSEQYYMLVDPAVNVLAETLYDYDGHTVVHPVIWTKTWGKGRVFFSALGHVAKEFSTFPTVRKMTMRGVCWAAGALPDSRK